MADIIEIFISYAREDEELLNDLKNHLKPLERRGLIAVWDEHHITPGTIWTQEIDKHINSARIFLLLVSPSYIASDNHHYEMIRAMDRYNSGEAHVIPILLRPVYWEEEPFVKLKPLPDNRQPVSSWHNKGDAFFTIAEGIRNVVENLIAAPPTAAVSTPIEPDKKELKGDLLASTQPDVSQAQQFDVYISYSHLDAEWVENLAIRLEDEHRFRIWLDKWILVPGQSSQQAMARGMDQANCCVVCISEHTPGGWFKREIERALNRQTKVSSFRVIPVLLPSASSVNVDDFLELNTWIDFSNSDFAYAFHRLACGVKGIPPGRWPPRGAGGYKGK